MQKTVFEFPARDVPDATILPNALATFLLDQVTFYAGASLEVLSAIRLHRALGLGSSVASSCRETLRAIVTSLQLRTLASADRRALLRYADELGNVPPNSDEARIRAILARMALGASPINQLDGEP